ncbi:MAG: hypothetical protein EA421_10285 [Gemmatimonadales bacterium]|nr:MAG: hypothetical protein EA421_10285 [Gemmatimonadales bacterium]
MPPARQKAAVRRGEEARAGAQADRNATHPSGRVAIDHRPSTLAQLQRAEAVASSPRQLAQMRTVAAVQRQPRALVRRQPLQRMGAPQQKGVGPCTGVVQRVGTVQRVSVADVHALRDDLLRLCHAGGAIAWDLYRAQLQIMVDNTNAAQERMSAYGPGTGNVSEAAERRAQAVTAFRALALQVRTHAKNRISDPDQAAAALEELGESVRVQMSEIAERAFRLGVKAEEEKGHIIAARHAFRAADRAEIAAGERPSVSSAEVRRGGGRRSAQEILADDVYGTGIDTVANTVVGGTVGSIAGGFGAVASEGTLAFNVGFGTGAVFGPLATMCSAIDLGLNLRSAVTTAGRRKQMTELASTLTGAQGHEVAAYAAEQKQRKLERRVAMSVGAGIGLAAGIAACVALGVATFGVGALVMGVIAAAIGLGFLIYKIARKSKWAQTKKMEHLARHLSSAAQDSEDPEAQQLALGQIGRLGVGDPSDYRAIATRLGEVGMSRRAMTAEWLVLLLTSGTRSERRDAGLILEGLKLEPEKLRGLVEAGNGQSATDKVMGKLASW